MVQLPVSKLKNVIILILALANILLLALVLPLRHQRMEQQSLAAQQLESLFSQYGVRLDTDHLPDDRVLYALEFSPEDDGALPAMKALLGDNVLVQDDSTRYLSLYRSELGQCQLSRGGSLEARLQSRPSVGDMSREVRELLEELGISVASVSLPQQRSAGIYTVVATQKLLEMPVFSSALTFTFHSGAVTRISGTAYFDTAGLVRTDDQACISCADALVAFLGSRDTLGWVGSAVVDVAQGYLRAETASAAVVRLIPGWRLTTDTGAFWINGITRGVTALDAGG